LRLYIISICDIYVLGRLVRIRKISKGGIIQHCSTALSFYTRQAPNISLYIEAG
jgi:hypothetical protein